MKLKRIFLAGASAAALAAVAIIPAVVTPWFSQTFEGLSDNAPYTGDEGATGGSWNGSIGAGVATVETVAGRKCIEIDTSKSEAKDKPIRFTAAAGATASVIRFEFAICAEPMPWYPTVAAGEKGALILMANDGGLLTFGGYTANGWKTLYGHGFTQHGREWIDCRAEFDYSGSTTYVTYYAKLDGVDFQPLACKEGGETSYQFEAAGSDDKARAIAFDGKGAVGAFAGQGVQYATTVNTWKTPGTAGDWEVPANWSLGHAPGEGEVAVIGAGTVVHRTVGGKQGDIHTYGDSKFVVGAGGSLSIESGDVELFGDYTTWGTIVVSPKAKLRAQGTFYGIEMGYASMLQIDPSTNVVVTTKPFHLDGVSVNMTASPSSALEAFVLAIGPYGSGGSLLNLTIGGTATTAWSGTWHGKLDGASALWIVNNNYKEAVAVWNDGSWGNLAKSVNWGDTKPGAEVAARVGNGQAHLNQWDTFGFSRYFEVGAVDSAVGEVDMSGGTVQGKSAEDAGSAVLVGKGRGNGLLDVVGGTVRPYDHLWNYAVTAGLDTHATGVVKVRGGILDAAGGGVSIGSGGAAQMEICEGRATVGGPFAVGYAGKLDVTGGTLTVSNSVYIGRTTRDESYDVAMTVGGGAVSNVTEGAFWVGSHGGVGSKATLTIAGGEVSAAERFVCGGYRSAQVDVTGGTLVAPEICVGSDFVDAADTARFNLVSGRVETAGFTSGTTGTRIVSLSGGELAATAANDDFFRGLDVVRLDGEATIRNEANVVTKAGLMGPGGFVKAGSGTLKVGGYAAWTGRTTVAEGTLDMDGGMIMGEIEIAPGATVVNAKYDDIDMLSFSGEVWKSGTASTKPYLGINKTLVADVSSVMKATGGDGVLKGAITFVAEEDGLTFAGWTPYGWTNLGFADGSAVVAGQSYEIRMQFDFDPKGVGGKGYVFYYVKRGDDYERLVSEDGLTAFPVAGALSVKTFDGSGLQVEIDADLVSRWKGAASGKWTEAKNWSTGTVPAYGMRAFVDTPATIDVSGANIANPISMLVANARVTLTGGALKFTGRATGAGAIVLSNATLMAGDVYLPVESAAGTENAIEGTSARLYGALRGEGTVSVTAQIYGDTQAFAGRVRMVDGVVCSAEAARNSRSAWNVSGYPFGVGGLAYEFGALSGSFSAESGDAANVTLVVGARDEDCALGGSWLAGSGSGLEWTASTATMTYNVANSSFVRLCGGGKLVIASTEDLPASISFKGLGGTLSFANGLSADPSGLILNSTAPVAFDDGGTDSTWATALDASNVGGFVKRGAGTLTLAATPKHSGGTVVEEGTIVVPYGTAFDSLSLSRNGKLVLDMAGRTDAGIALAVGNANRNLIEENGKTLIGKYIVVSNAVPGLQYSVVPVGDRGLVISYGSDTFVWRGGQSDNRWANVSNWTVGGRPAGRLPQEQDDVCFMNAATVVIDDDVASRNLVCTNILTLQGSNKMSVAGSVLMSSGYLMLDGMTLVAPHVELSSLAGTGTVQVTTGVLELSSQGDSAFVGTLNVTNFVKSGEGTFEYEPLTPFAGVVAVEEGALRWNCSNGDLTNQPSAFVTMKAGATLHLNDLTVEVGGFAGAGTVEGGVLVTADGIVTQVGGALRIPAVDRTTYVASHAGEKLEIMEASDKDVRIVLPRTWFVAGVSGKRAVHCGSKNILWDIRSKTAVEPVDEQDGWWSIGGGGFTVRLR